MTTSLVERLVDKELITFSGSTFSDAKSVDRALADMIRRTAKAIAEELTIEERHTTRCKLFTLGYCKCAYAERNYAIADLEELKRKAGL